MLHALTPPDFIDCLTQCSAIYFFHSGFHKYFTVFSFILKRMIFSGYVLSHNVIPVSHNQSDVSPSFCGLSFSWALLDACDGSPVFALFRFWQAQYSHHVIQEILGHLDARKRDPPRVRAGIIQVLLEAVAIAAKGSIGECQQKRKPAKHCCLSLAQNVFQQIQQCMENSWKIVLTFLKVLSFLLKLWVQMPVLRVSSQCTVQHFPSNQSLLRSLLFSYQDFWIPITC